MSIKLKQLLRRGLTAALALALSCGIGTTAYAAGGLEMYTDYPGIIVQAGDTVSFPLVFDNSTGSACDVNLGISSIPDGWEGYFKGSSNEISRVQVQPGTGTSTATFTLDIPEDVSEGSYPVELSAVSTNGLSDILELELVVKTQSSGASKFTAQYPELQGSLDTAFSFSMTLANNGAVEQSYSLSAQPPEGWQVSFKPSSSSSQVASLSVEAGMSQGLTVTVTPPESASAGTYTIPCSAVSASENLSAELTVIITGSYDLQLSTPSGRLSFESQADKETPLTLSVTNTGSSPLQNINFTSSLPAGWNIRFETPTIDTLEVGATTEVAAYITPGSDALTGDYVASITASTVETSSTADFRVSVKTSLLWGIVGFALIVAMLLGVSYIFRKYGRR